jgi:hypothetical protein
MIIETDPKKLKEIADKKWDENWEFVFRLIGVVENYAVCPIVFNVHEHLKVELWYEGDFQK